MYISFASWNIACQMIRQEGRRLSSYLQWYPFYRLSNSSWEKLMSEDYFKKYIEDGSFVLCESMRYTTKGYIQKQGSSLRDSYLVAPVLFLYLLAYGVEYNKTFVPPRSQGLILYAGNLERRQMDYQTSWQTYCKALKRLSTDYEYCLRTDISNFFGTINVDSLISKMQRYSDGNYTASDGFFLKAILLYCGNGKYPIIQNHPTLSFLATHVYLAEIDQRIQSKLRGITTIKSFELVRYVDDMCLFFNVSDDADLPSTKQAIVNCYADILRSESLILNQGKLGLQNSNEVLKSMASVSYVDFSRATIDDEIIIPETAIPTLFLKLSEAVKSPDYSQKDLLDIIESCFDIEESPTPPLSLFRHCLYRQQTAFQTVDSIDAMRIALQNGTVLFSYNTTDLVQSILNSRDDGLIKQLLNSLFQSSRNGTWSSLDSLISVIYLIHRGMQHSDLRRHLQFTAPGLSNFCESYCHIDFVGIAPTNNEAKIIAILSGDKPSKMQYAQYLRHEKANNLFEGASYYRAFFDRLSSYIASRVQGKKHKWLFKENDLKVIYASVPNFNRVIRKIEKLRQDNPLIHASSKILESPTFELDLAFVIKSIDEIITHYLSTISLDKIVQQSKRMNATSIQTR